MAEEVYIVFFTAQRTSETQQANVVVRPCVIQARSAAEAQQGVLSQQKREYPAADGWREYAVVGQRLAPMLAALDLTLAPLPATFHRPVH